jgi:hypothetical protein
MRSGCLRLAAAGEIIWFGCGTPYQTQDLWDALGRQVPAVRHCYEVALRRDADLEGTLMVRLIVLSDGTIPDIQFLAPSIGDEALHGCVRDVLKATAVQAPRTSLQTIVKLPFHFRAIEVGPGPLLVPPPPQEEPPPSTPRCAGPRCW